jgi:putative chitinase
MVDVELQHIVRLAPNARSSYRDAFAHGQPVLDAAGISASALRVTHFMAQVLHECGGLTIQFENLNYSAARLPKVWPRRFRPTGPLDPALYANNAEKLANEVYGGRLGNTAPGDGFRFRGRGMLQVTGRDGYRQVSAELRRHDPTAPDFETDPDLVISADWALKVAAALWTWKGCNAFADSDSVEKVTQRINGGQIGIADRKDWLRRCKALWLP